MQVFECSVLTLPSEVRCGGNFHGLGFHQLGLKIVCLPVHIPCRHPRILDFREVKEGPPKRKAVGLVSASLNSATKKIDM
jgi:hypothetical protein